MPHESAHQPATSRLLINRDKVGEKGSSLMALLRGSEGFVFGEGNYRDALYLGDCDAGARALAKARWRRAFRALPTALPFL